MTPLCPDEVQIIVQNGAMAVVVGTRWCGLDEGHVEDHLTIFNGQPFRWPNRDDRSKESNGTR